MQSRNLKWTQKSNWLTWSMIIVLGAVSLTSTVALVYLSAMRSLNPAEGVALQVGALGAGIFASWMFTQSSATKAAQETMRFHTRPAFRRVLDLYISLGRLSDRIGMYNAEKPDYRLDVIEAIVDEQLGTMGSALEDWRDIVPEDVEEIAERMERTGGIGR